MTSHDKCQTFYPSDVVSSRNNNLGVIIEMPDSDSDDGSDDEGLPKDAAMVSWYPSGEEEILLQKELSLKSRVLEPGMGVERQGDYRSGVLLDVTANCSVKLVGTNNHVSNVPGPFLTPWNLHYHEPNVVCGSWLGYILEIQQTLVVGLKNGARVLMKFDTARHMEDSKFSEISPYYSGTWYVGQRLEGKAMWFKRATVLSGQMPVFKTTKQKVKGVVLEAILTGMEVEWITHGFMTPNKPSAPPPTFITGEEMLAKIRVFERYQQRLLTIGLPALLKLPTTVNIQKMLDESKNGRARLDDFDLPSKSESPVHQCFWNEEESSEKIDAVPPTNSDAPNDEQSRTSNLIFETKIDDKINAEVERSQNRCCKKCALAKSPSSQSDSVPLGEATGNSNNINSLIENEGNESSREESLITKTQTCKGDGAEDVTEDASAGHGTRGFSTPRDEPQIDEKDPMKVESCKNNFAKEQDDPPPELGCQTCGSASGSMENWTEFGLEEEENPDSFDQLAIGSAEETDSEDEDEEDDNHSESSSDHESDSGLDDSLETNKGEVVEKSPDAPIESEPPGADVTPNREPLKPGKRWNKRVKTTKNPGWCSKITPKGPIEIKGQYLVEITDATYTAKVLWEDGSREDVPCTELNQIDHLDDHAHMPGYFVNKIGNVDQFAVVSRYNSKDRTCTVHWLESDKVEEDVSVYSLEYNRKFDYNPMDIILCSVMCSHSFIGQIIYVTDTGKLLVQWTDGVITTISPDKCIQMASFDTDYDDISDMRMSEADYDDISDDDYAEADDDTSSWMTAESDWVTTDDSDTEQSKCPANVAEAVSLFESRIAGRTANKEAENVDENEEFQEASSEPLIKESEDKTSHDTDPNCDVGCDTNVSDEVKADVTEDLRGGAITEEVPNNSAEEAGKSAVDDYRYLLNKAMAQNAVYEERKKAQEALENGGENTTEAMDGITMMQQFRKRSRNTKDADPGAATDSTGLCGLVELTATMQEHAAIISTSFKMLPVCPTSHHFHGNLPPGAFQREFLNAVRKDIKLISTNLPSGIWVRAYEDRIDLLSCLIEGPADTPYEGVLFVFDVQLGRTYSSSPPSIHYVSYSQTKLNPNLYPEGKVCLSLLGTWMGRGTEQWTKSSNLLQLFVSIQSLVLNSTPYYNEAGFNKYRETQSGETNAKLYNEMIFFKILQHVASMYDNAHKSFEQEIKSYYAVNIPKTIARYNRFIKYSEGHALQPDESLPTYPLLPLSRGVIPCIQNALSPLLIISAVGKVYGDGNGLEHTAEQAGPSKT